MVSSRRGLILSALTACGLLSVGCFSEQAFPHRAADVRRVAIPGSAVAREGHTRAWIEHFRDQFADELPADDPPARVTEELTDADGAPIDVLAAYDLDPATVHTVFGNFDGVLHSAQSTGADLYIEQRAPTWPGCEWVSIPIDAELELHGQLGLARRDGRVIEADCIVILPGFFGDTGPQRSRILSQLFLANGYHVLGLEQRGAGQTERFYPDVPYTFGVLETADLLAVAEWLQARPEIRRTGLIGACWGANKALLAAWETGRPAASPFVSPGLRPLRFQPTMDRHYEAGVIALSPTLRFEEFADRCELSWSIWDDAIIDKFQQEVETRQRRKGNVVNGSLRDLVDSELARTAGYYPGVVAEGFTYLRLLPYRDLPAGDKLEHARVPTLILHAANDPMGNAQDVADLVATLDNPRVAALMLPGGGHLGFAPYAQRYFYSLLVSFFDPERGPAANVP